MTDTSYALMLTEEFLEKVKEVKEDMRRKYNSISHEETPRVDGQGNKIVDKRPDGYDYIVESYMRGILDKHFPGWSWESAAPLQFLGSEWVVAQGHLVIIDESLLAFGILPPLRRFYGVDSVRIQYKSGQPHTNENIIDVGDSCKSANSAALKYAINRLCHIGDDVYGKRVEYEGAGTLEDVLEIQANAKSFGKLVDEHKLLWSDVYKILGVSSIGEIGDFNEAWQKVKEAKGL